MVLSSLLLYIISFVTIWLGAGLIVSSVDRISKKLKFSSFAVSFFVLGILTSIPEFAVGLTAVAEGTPQIFVGNLLGGIIIIFMVIMPILAIFGNGIRLQSSFADNKMLITLAAIMTPAVVALDKKITLLESGVLILVYGALFYFIQRDKGVFDSVHTKALRLKYYSFMDILKILLGVAIVFVSSNVIVDKTVYFAEVFNVSAFFVSLVVLSLGTNLPELSLAVRSVISGKKDIAYGDYVGSAAANILLLGVLTLISGGNVISQSDFLTTFIFMGVGLGLFFYFSNSRKMLTRKEGLIIFAVYVGFALFELIRQL